MFEQQLLEALHERERMRIEQARSCGRERVVLMDRRFEGFGPIYTEVKLLL